ncbi:MAG: ATP-binding protein [Pirellulales bacterium]
MPDRLKVLLVEDNPDGAAYIGRLFDRAGTTAVMEWASKFQTGMKRLAEGNLDAALINLDQPECQGLETLARARAQNDEVPIIVLTTLDDVDTAAAAVHRGADDFIIKEHLTADLLHRSIEHAGRHRQAAEELAYSKEALKRSDQRFAAILNASLDCIITIDADGCILDLNPAAERMLGFSRDEALSQDMGDLLLDEKSRKRLRRNVEQYQNRGEGSMLGTRIELTAIRKSGEPFIAEMATQPIPMHGTLVFTVFLRDITTRRRAEEELKRYSTDLERSNQDLDQYASIVSHDLLAPLRAVTSFCELLKRHYGGQLDETADEYIQFIVEGSERMRTLVQDLRTYARVATEAKPLERLDCQAVIRRVLNDLDTEIYESEANVTNDPLPVVMADKTQLTQLFQNLIANAIKYRSEEPPQIHISAKNEQTVWRFSVQDNGIGFEQKFADRVFQIFRRLHSDEENYSGTGIGLAICKRIVERHQGEIGVESNPGDGSHFYFTLPTEIEA